MLRYERKFLVTELSPEDVVLVVKLNPIGFLESYSERWINSIYIDTLNLKSATDNLDGLVDRTKFRVRWYGAAGGEVLEPVLEVKSKSGLLGWKDRYPLPSRSFDDLSDAGDMKEMVQGTQDTSRIVAAAAGLFPIVMVRYRRKYFEDRTGVLRVTIDKMISYQSLAPRSRCGAPLGAGDRST